MYVLIIEADAFSCAGRQRGAVQQAGRQLLSRAGHACHNCRVNVNLLYTANTVVLVDLLQYTYVVR